MTLEAGLDHYVNEADVLETRQKQAGVGWVYIVAQEETEAAP